MDWSNWSDIMQTFEKHLGSKLFIHSKENLLNCWIIELVLWHVFHWNESGHFCQRLVDVPSYLNRQWKCFPLGNYGSQAKDTKLFQTFQNVHRHTRTEAFKSAASFMQWINTLASPPQLHQPSFAANFIGYDFDTLKHNCHLTFCGTQIVACFFIYDIIFVDFSYKIIILNHILRFYLHLELYLLLKSWRKA